MDMKQTERKTEGSNSSPGILKLLKGCVYGAFTGIVLLLVFSMLLRYTSLDDKYLNLLSYIAIAAAGLSCGFVCARAAGHGGLLYGGAGGLLLAVLLYLIGAALGGGFAPIGKILTNVIIILVAAVLGGIFGVNRRHKKRV